MEPCRLVKGCTPGCSVLANAPRKVCVLVAMAPQVPECTPLLTTHVRLRDSCAAQLRQGAERQRDCAPSSCGCSRRACWGAACAAAAHVHALDRHARTVVQLQLDPQRLPWLTGALVHPQLRPDRAVAQAAAARQMPLLQARAGGGTANLSAAGMCAPQAAVRRTKDLLMNGVSVRSGGCRCTVRQCLARTADLSTPGRCATRFRE